MNDDDPLRFWRGLFYACIGAAVIWLALALLWYALRGA